MSTDLPWHQHFNRAGHNLRALFGIGGRRPVGLRREDDHYVVESEGTQVHVPSALRWRFYRFGMAKRLQKLSSQYGFDRFGSHVGQGDLVVDIGANVGEFAMIAAGCGARCISVEADARVFGCLQKNVATLPAVVPVQTLLWREATDLTFWSEPSHADSSVFQPEDMTSAEQITLPARPLDDVLAEIDADSPIAFIKCDAEGAEPEVLEGAKATLARVRTIAIDTGAEREGQGTSDACEAILSEAGFAVETLRPLNRTITLGQRAA